MHDKSKELRYLLATVGIKLDDPPAALGSVPVIVARDEKSELSVRDRIMEILIAAGAPAPDVAWLTASCPGVEAALGYVPPVRVEVEDLP